MNKTALCVLLFLSLSGCTRTVWMKQNASQGDFEQIKATCMLEAAERVPQDNRLALVSHGFTRSVQQCRHRGRCLEYIEYVPPRYSVYDNNQSLRDQIVRACFYRNGWQEFEINEDP